MNNLDKHEWTFTKDEKTAIKILEEQNFEVTVKKRFLHSMDLENVKNGINYDVKIPVGYPRMKMKKYMNIVLDNFNKYCELLELRKKVEA